MTTQVGVSVVVITYNDAVHLPNAIESALAQGDVVSEIVVVDDASTDDTPRVLGRWGRDRVRVVRRTTNSGGCGAPRNDGTAFAQSPWIFYLDSDDVLPPGAIDALYAAATDDVDFVAGLCVRRELPEGRETPWQPQLFERPGLHTTAERPRTLWDTLSVNKLYRRSFLVDRGIQFPSDAAHYEDFTFTAEVYAQAFRFAVIDTPVYTWNVRRQGNPSISLRRDRLRNWHDRLAAHANVLDIMRKTGDPHLVDAAERKFLEHDLRLYLRDLPARDVEYQRGWWEATRAHLADFTDRAIADVDPAAEWAAAVIRHREAPTDLGRLAELAIDPPRLVPPYAGSPAAPVWDGRHPAVPLVALPTLPLTRLPLDIEAEVTVAGPRISLALRLADLYGRVPSSRVAAIDIELRDRMGHITRERPTTLTGTAADGAIAAHAILTGAALRGTDAFSTWDIWARVTFTDGARSAVRVRAAGGAGLGRHLVPDLRRGVLLVQPYRTASHSLAVRVADGPGGAAAVASARIRRKRRSRA